MYLFFWFFFWSDFHQCRQSKGPKWIRRRHHLVSMQIFVPRSSRINSGLLAADVNMSIPGKPSIAQVGTCALLSGAHTSEHHTAARKKNFGSSRHPLVTNPKVPCVPKRGSGMTLQSMPEAYPPLLLFHLVHPSTVHYCVIVVCIFTLVGAYLYAVTFFGIAVSNEAIIYRYIDSSRT